MSKQREIILTALVMALAILGFVLCFYLGMYYWNYVRPSCPSATPTPVYRFYEL